MFKRRVNLQRAVYAAAVGNRANMRPLSGCLLVVGLGAVVGLEKIHGRTHVANRGMQQALSHNALHDPNPCAQGYIKVFNPQLSCQQVQPASDTDGLIVITEETCQEVINGIKTKTPPYWDVEEQRCAPESRVQLLTQCAQKTANFSATLQVRRLRCTSRPCILQHPVPETCLLLLMVVVV